MHNLGVVTEGNSVLSVFMVQAMLVFSGSQNRVISGLRSAFSASGRLIGAYGPAKLGRSILEAPGPQHLDTLHILVLEHKAWWIVSAKLSF